MEETLQSTVEKACVPTVIQSIAMGKGVGPCRLDAAWI